MAKIFSTFIFYSIIVFTSFAQSNNQYILLLFEGSDWCSSCRRFNKEILNEQKVISFLNKNNIEIKHIDFPQRAELSKEQEKVNREYAEKYGFQGVFPTIILAPVDTKEFYTLNSTKISPDEFISWLQGKITLDK